MCTQMRGVATNQLGKVERHKKIKEGPCIFPFKYKHQEHRACLKTEKGKICATSVNERGTMQTYGYCEEVGVRAPPRRRLTLRKASASRSAEKPKRATLRRSSSGRKKRRATPAEKVLDLGPYREVGRSGVEGKEGLVLLVERKDEPGEVLALKRFKKGKSLAKVRREADMQARAAATGAAPGVVAVLETERPGIVMERMGKTVVDVCKEQGGQLTDAQQKHILCAYERLDKAGVLHNDSNPLNLMVSDKAGKGPPWGFVDYGFAKQLSKKDSNLRIGLRTLLHATKGLVSRKICTAPHILEAALQQGTTRPQGVGPLTRMRIESFFARTQESRTENEKEKERARIIPEDEVRSQDKETLADPGLSIHRPQAAQRGLRQGAG